VAASTIGQQRFENIGLTIGDEETFVRTILDGLDASPRYSAHMAPRNRLGPEPIDLSPPMPADPSELAAPSTLGSGSSTSAHAPRTRGTTSSGP